MTNQEKNPSSSSSNPNKRRKPENETPPRTSPPTRPQPPNPAATPPRVAVRRRGEGGSAPNRDQRLALIPVGGSGIEVGGGAGGSSSGAVGVPEQAGRPQPQKRKIAEVVAPEGVTPTCSVCDRTFLSWKALFGHMRSHPDRTWRGCYPPPHGDDPPPVPAPPVQGEASSAGIGTFRSGPEILDFDLNEPQVETLENKDGLFDLNKPPAKEDSE